MHGGGKNIAASLLSRLGNNLEKTLFFPKILTVFLGLLLFVFVLTIPAVTLAASDTLEIIGDGVANPITLTREQLEEMKQHQEVYSTINTWPTKKWYVGKGIKLWDLLLEAGIKKEEATLVRFTAVDGYTVMLTMDELFQDRRFRFPNFKLSSGGDGDGHLPGDPSGEIQVESIIALISVEGSDNPKYMNDLNTLLLMLGQRTVTEQTGNLFVKYLNKIEVFTKEPEQWDAPQANPGSGTVHKGTMITLSNLHNDDDKVYYTTDGSTPTMNSPMYNWIASRWWSSRADVLGKINHPIGPINEDTTIKAVTIGPSKLDSEVVTFSYKVADSADGAATKPDDDTPVPEKGQEQAKGLMDLQDHWAEEAIKKLVALGAVSGYPDGNFLPNKTITRAEFATIVVKAFNLEPITGKIFSDTAGHWAKEAIATAQAHGIVNGYSETVFGPNDNITREQMAVMIVKAANISGAAEGRNFADSDRISTWAGGAVASASENGIITGYPDQTFGPQGQATRAEAATVVVKALK
jgi:hypothetical protein